MILKEKTEEKWEYLDFLKFWKMANLAAFFFLWFK